MEMKNTEIWKDVQGYEGLYAVSDLGRVKRLAGKGCKNERILKPQYNSKGYLYVSLYKCGKSVHLAVHRLVAATFIPNPDKLPEVNHKDENKTNNRVDNLEYCDGKYNCNYGTRNERRSETQRNRKDLSKPILCVETGVIFQSAREASRWIHKKNAQTNILHCLKGRTITAYGYKWQYAI